MSPATYECPTTTAAPSGLTNSWHATRRCLGVNVIDPPDNPRDTSKRAPRTLSGWQRFLKEQFKERAELKKELKDPAAKINLGKALADIGDKWQSLPAKEKQPYLDAAAASKPKPKPKTKGLSGYALFVKENFENVKARNPTIRHKEVLVNMGHEWKAKSDADKEKYKKRAEEYNKTL